MKNIVFTFVFILILAGFVSAGTGAIWTTTSDCYSPQDENHYALGETVYIHGENFDELTTYDWDISGLGGSEESGASCDPGMIVASGEYLVNETGAFCFAAYTIEMDDCGEYKVTFGNKHDNYRIDLDLPVVPEFGTVVGIATALGALGVFFIVRRK